MDVLDIGIDEVKGSAFSALKKSAKMVDVIVVCGTPRSGKDSFVRILSETTTLDVRSVTSVGFVYQLLENMGYEGAKNAELRKFISTVKNAAIELCDYPTTYISNFISHLILRNTIEQRRVVVCVQIREMDEIAKLMAECFVMGVGSFRVVMVESNREKIGDGAESNEQCDSYDETTKIKNAFNSKCDIFANNLKYSQPAYKALNDAFKGGVPYCTPDGKVWSHFDVLKNNSTYECYVDEVKEYINNNLF